VGKVRDFCIGLPSVCGSENSGPWEYGNMLMFDGERKRSGGPLARSTKDLEEPFRRFQPAFGFTAFKHDKKAAAYAMGVMELLGLSHYRFAHKEPQWDKRIKELQIKLLPQEAEFPQVAALMTVEEASSARVATNWN